MIKMAHLGGLPWLLSLEIQAIFGWGLENLIKCGAYPAPFEFTWSVVAEDIYIDTKNVCFNNFIWFSLNFDINYIKFRLYDVLEE